MKAIRRRWRPQNAAETPPPLNSSAIGRAWIEKVTARAEQEGAESIEALSRQDEYVARYGNRGAALNCIYQCLELGIPVPQWAAQSFCEAFRRVRRGDIEKNSWDAVFGQPHLGKHIDSIKRERAVAIYLRVEQIRAYEGAASAPLDDQLFDRIGQEFGMKKSRCKKLYQWWKRHETKLQAVGLGVATK